MNDSIHGDSLNPTLIADIKRKIQGWDSDVWERHWRSGSTHLPRFDMRDILAVNAVQRLQGWLGHNLFGDPVSDPNSCLIVWHFRD